MWSSRKDQGVDVWTCPISRHQISAFSQASSCQWGSISWSCQSKSPLALWGAPRPLCPSRAPHFGCCPPDHPHSSRLSLSGDRGLVGLHEQCLRFPKNSQYVRDHEHPTEMANPRCSAFWEGWGAALLVRRPVRGVWASQLRPGRTGEDESTRPLL